MKGKWKVPFWVLLALYYLLLSQSFKGCFSAFRLPRPSWKKQSRYYQVTINVGQPPKPYFLDIDTGSDLTWLQCDVPCAKCTPAPHSLYKQNKNIVKCKDPVCASLHLSADHHCHTTDEQCDYEVEYADHGSSLGVLVKDAFPLRFTNGSIVSLPLVFGSASAVVGTIKKCQPLLVHLLPMEFLV